MSYEYKCHLSFPRYPRAPPSPYRTSRASRLKPGRGDLPPRSLVARFAEFNGVNTPDSSGDERLGSIFPPSPPVPSPADVARAMRGARVFLHLSIDIFLSKPIRDAHRHSTRTFTHTETGVTDANGSSSVFSLDVINSIL